MRYIVIGAGAVGGAIGARLHQSGAEVVLVARGEHLARMQSAGLRFVAPDGDTTLQIPAIAGPDEIALRADDVLILAVKTQDTVSALETWRFAEVAGGGHAADRLPLICAQNGVESERIAQRYFASVYGMCVWLPATFLEAGQVIAQGDSYTGVLTIGRYPSGSDATIEAVSADLEKSRFLAPVSSDVMRWKYTKLISNLANAVDAITDDARSENGQRLVKQVQAEGNAVLEAAGIDYAAEAEEVPVRDKFTMKSIPGFKRGGGSSWQSLTRGTGSIETDFLNGEIVFIARSFGLEAPANAVLQEIATEFLRRGLAPGAMSVDELSATIGGRTAAMSQ